MSKPRLFCDSISLISLHINCWQISDGTKKWNWLMKRKKEPLHNCIRRIAIANMPVSDYVEKKALFFGFVCLCFVFHVIILIISNKRHHHMNKSDIRKSNAVIAVVNISQDSLRFYLLLFAFCKSLICILAFW